MTVRFSFWLAAFLPFAAAQPAGPADSPARVPVLLELFTSEGCSSCPPADELLEKLDRLQPVRRAQIIVVSEHVDYWNSAGWKDPYSSAANTARQVSYVHKLGVADGPYTPMMIVDGKQAFNGSDAQQALSAIESEAKESKVAVRIVPGAPDGPVTVEVDPLPDGPKHDAAVFVVVAEESGTQDVLRGENQGHKLHHVSILRSVKQVGKITQRAGLKIEVPLPHEGGPVRLIAFVQSPDYGPVRGAAAYAVGR